MFYQRQKLVNNHQKITVQMANQTVNKIEVSGWVCDGGRLPEYARQNIRNFLIEKAGQRVKVELKVIKDKATQRQHGFYRGVIVPVITNFFNEERTFDRILKPIDTHGILVTKFLGFEEAMESEALGIKYERLKSTADLNKNGQDGFFEGFVEEVMWWAWETLGIEIDYPNKAMFAVFKEIRDGLFDGLMWDKFVRFFEDGEADWFDELSAMINQMNVDGDDEKKAVEEMAINRGKYLYFKDMDTTEGIKAMSGFYKQLKGFDMETQSWYKIEFIKDSKLVALRFAFGWTGIEALADVKNDVDVDWDSYLAERIDFDSVRAIRKAIGVRCFKFTPKHDTNEGVVVVVSNNEMDAFKAMNSVGTALEMNVAEYIVTDEAVVVYADVLPF